MIPHKQLAIIGNVLISLVSTFIAFLGTDYYYYNSCIVYDKSREMIYSTVDGTLIIN